jgi:hypothetical protein
MIAFIVLSRSSLFGSFAFDPVFVAIQLVSLLVALASAMALRVAAESARSKATGMFVQAKLKTLAKGPSDGFRAQIDLLLERVGNLSVGAFSPLSHQPVVRALLLPLGTYGSTTFLGYLTGGNL